MTNNFLFLPKAALLFIYPFSSKAIFIKLEAIFIKTSSLILCRQKEFVYNLTLLSH